MKKLSFTIILFLLFIGLSQAQNAEKKWSLDLGSGLNQYYGDLGSGIYNFSKTNYIVSRAGINSYLNPSFDLSLQGTYSHYGYWKTAALYENFRAIKTQGNLLLKYKLNNGYLLKEEAKFAPFLAIGAGIAGFQDRTVTGGTDMMLPVGGGIKYNLTKSIAVQYLALYNFTNSDNRDYNEGGINDQFLEQTLGIVISFGKGPKDTDGDGIIDKLDRCPDKAGLETFMGCPDSDGDGIADIDDKCPTVKGITQFNGCPDTDGDGIQDSEDKCPTVKGLVAFNGCPDTDGDGIQDSEDKCPTVKGLETFNGCPDSDGDGVQDSEDICPNDKGLVALQGCPDSDNDGIKDSEDKCPDVFGIAANKGCPEVKEETLNIFEQALTGIQFETGKDIIQPKSYSILNQVAKVMSDYPNYNLDIYGHTDSQGDAAKNLDLSQRRANSVKKYLSDKGIDAKRMNTKGFGITKPIADNATAAGRAKNRRVEFKVIF